MLFYYGSIVSVWNKADILAVWFLCIFLAMETWAAAFNFSRLSVVICKRVVRPVGPPILRRVKGDEGQNSG